MVDIVSANEFTFSPSAFLAAYIEQNQVTTVTDSTVNGGSVITNPNSINSLKGNVPPEEAGFEARTLSAATAGTVFFSPNTPTSNYLSSSGSIVDIVGQTLTNNSSVTQTTSTSVGANNTVVLVLSYGQFRAKCADAQATVIKIYQEVAAYLNAL